MDDYTIWKEFQSNGRRKPIASPPSRRRTIRSRQDDAGDARRSQSTRGRDPGGAPITGARKRRAHERHVRTDRGIAATNQRRSCSPAPLLERRGSKTQPPVRSRRYRGISAHLRANDAGVRDRPSQTPQLTGKAQQAYAALSADEVKSYGTVKTAIIRRYNINDETYRRQFRAAKLRKEETPQTCHPSAGSRAQEGKGLQDDTGGIRPLSEGATPQLPARRRPGLGPGKEAQNQR